MFLCDLADIVYKGNEYELTDSVMVSMECIGAVALYLFRVFLGKENCDGNRYGAERIRSF